MIGEIQRVKENKYYILYIRKNWRKELLPKYVIYSTEEYDSCFAKDFKTYKQAIKSFTKATQEAKDYEKELEEIFKL